MEIKKYISIKDLEVYRLARELSKMGWQIYKPFKWQTRKMIGDQFIESTDSVGANIAEGYSRHHYLDKIKFFYNARASLSECSDHWIELLRERDLVDDKQCQIFKDVAKKLEIKLNHFITANYRTKEKYENK